MKNFLFFAFIYFFAYSIMAATSYQVPASGNLFISEFGYCATVTNNKSNDVFVPTKTSNEFTAFLSAAIAGNISSVTASTTGCTCKSLRYAGDTTSGLKMIDPDGPGAQASFEVYCDMSTAGGGWMLIARSVLGASTASGTFGWGVVAGSASNDAIPYSMGSTLLSTLTWSELLFGDYSSGKTWGTNIYKHTTIPSSYLTAAYSKYYATASHDFYPSPGSCSATGTVVNPTPVTGTNTLFAMARTIGYTDRADVYFFRDCYPSTTNGLNASRWQTYYADYQGGNLLNLPGMIMVR